MSEHEEYMTIYTIERLSESIKKHTTSFSLNSTSSLNHTSSILQTQSTDKNINKIKNKLKT